jgi:hypothetical protein
MSPNFRRLEERLIVVLFAALWLFVAIDLLVGSLAVRRIAEVVLATLLVLAVRRASRHLQVVGIVLVAGTIAIAGPRGDWGAVERGLRAALVFAAFLPIIMLLRVTVEHSPTVATIRTRLTAAGVAGRRAWMLLGAHILAAILTMGFVPVMRPMLPAQLSEDERVSLASNGVRGLGLAGLWSPFFMASAVAVQLVPTVPAWQTIGLGLALAGMGLGLSFLGFSPGLTRPELGDAIRRLGPLLPPTALVVGAVAVVGALTGWTSLQAIVLIVPFACIAYLWRLPGVEMPVVARRVASSVGRIGDELVVMTAATVFGAAIGAAGLPDGLGDAVEFLARYPVVVIAADIVIIFVIGVLGLHPMVTAAIVIPITQSLGVPIADPVLVHAVIAGWTMSATVAIWTLPVVISATMFEIPVRRLVFGPNVRFLALFLPLVVAVLGTLNWVLMRG